MKKINCYTGDSFLFHKKVVKSKKNRTDDQQYKVRLESLHNDIETLYVTHSSHFDNDKLHLLIPYGYIGQAEIDLRSLYVYKSAPIQKLIVALTTTSNNRVDKLCRFCTINNIGTLDHYLPQSVFPEFVVNPKNLFPMCSDCNTRKGNIILNNGIQGFLNLYIDELPEIQYLFVTFDVNLAPIFIVENRNGIDPILFSVIESHYSRLQLCSRFSSASNKVYSKLRDTVRNFLRNTSLEIITNNTIDTANDQKSIYGFNFWESILEIELIKNPDFIAECRTI